MTGNNPKLDLFNVDVHKKFDQNLSICSQDIEWKPNSHGITESREDGRTGWIQYSPTSPKWGYKNAYFIKMDSDIV